MEWLLNLYLGLRLSETIAVIAATGTVVAGIIILSIIVNFIIKKILLKAIGKVVSKTKTIWDDEIYHKGVFNRLSHIVPALVIYFLAPLPFPDNMVITGFIQRLAVAYMIGIAILVLDALLSSIHSIYQTYKISKSRPIKGYLQVLKIVITTMGIILMITTVLDRSAAGILGGIGALSAVLMLVFKDSILGLVAGMQLAANNMVKIGDWIEMPSYGADGDVIDITLQSVKVQNWDKTISTIPIYSLISSSFKNWRGMSESGGRRIKRAINIDMNTVQFCTPEMIERFSRFEFLTDYLISRQKEIEEYNVNHNVTDAYPVNGRRMTNIGTFRAYILSYLRQHPMVNQEMTLLVRQLPPGPQGLPIEIYLFCSDKVWANYEGIQADIFDHLLAAVPEFNLSVFQHPSGRDFRLIRGE
ncbi:MAG: mechanosensitive ion channel [Spirochaetales bacterium]|nr:mechanosensitive ion channel [Spirochaetales bacterium]